MKTVPPCEGGRHRWGGRPFLGPDYVECCTRCPCRRQKVGHKEYAYAKLHGAFADGTPQVFEWNAYKGEWYGPTNEAGRS